MNYVKPRTRPKEVKFKQFRSGNQTNDGTLGIFYEGHRKIETKGLQGGVPYKLLSKCRYFD